MALRPECHVERGYVCVKATGRWWVGAGWGHSFCRSCHGWATPDPQRGPKGPKGQATAISPCSPGRENPGPGHWVLGAWGPWEQPAGPSGPESRDPDTRLSPGGWHVQTWALVSVAFRVQTHTHAHVCLHEQETRVRKFSWRGLLVPASLTEKNQNKHNRLVSNRVLKCFCTKADGGQMRLMRSLPENQKERLSGQMCNVLHPRHLYSSLYKT